MDVPVPSTWDEAVEQLVPLLRRRAEAPRADHLARDFAADLEERVALDLPDVRVLVTRDHLRAWGAPPEAAFAAARDNLAYAATDGLRFREEWGLWHLDAPDGLAPSRLLLPGFLAGFAGRVAGRPVAAIPAARILLVGGDGDPATLATLARLAEAGFREAAGPLTPRLLT